MMNEIIYIRICHIYTYTFPLSPLEAAQVEEADIVTATDNTYWRLPSSRTLKQ